MSDEFCQACPRLAIYEKMRKNSLSAQFSVGRYIVPIKSSPSSRPHQAVPIKPSPSSRPHQAVPITQHQAVPTTKPCSPPSSAHHQAVLTTKQCSPPSSAEQKKQISFLSSRSFFLSFFVRSTFSRFNCFFLSSRLAFCE